MFKISTSVNNKQNIIMTIESLQHLPTEIEVLLSASVVKLLNGP